MKRKFWLAACSAAAILPLVLAACGGGSSGTSSGSTSTSGAVPASSASGTITAFGSVFVNGAEYAVGSGTSVVDGDADDAASSSSALQVGMQVDVDATNGTATLLRFTSAVRGEVDAVNATASTLTVLGQTVAVSSGTSFGGSKTSGGTTTAITSLSNISVGDYVVVYGYIVCTGSSSSTSSCSTGTTQVNATLVYEPASAGAYRVEGYAEGVAANGSSFTINGLTVDVNSATACTPSPCSISNGQFVAVRSTSAPSGSGSSLTLTANEIKALSVSPTLVPGETASIQGLVQNLNASAATFTVRGITIDASASSLASTLANLADGDIVQVAGTVNADGSLTATSITVENVATFSLMAPLTAISSSADTITVFGQTFTVGSSTRFIDLAQDVRPFNFSNFATVLATGDQLIVSGYTNASGALVATLVARIPTPSSPLVAVQGIVSSDSPTADTLTIDGITVTLNSTTTLLYPGANGTPSVSGFLSAITAGTTVATAIGTPGSAGGTMTATTAWLLNSNTGWEGGGRY